jgi:putative flippase GtrA
MISAEQLLQRARSPQGQKAIRYTLTSVISVIVSQALLALFFGIFQWSARSANLLATSVATVPSYVLNRHWAWGKRGKSHFWKEVAPFWGLAFIGLAFSTWAADWAESTFDRSALAVNAASLGAFGVLWVAKFVIFNEILFKHHPEVLEENPALDGHTGLPT